MLLCPQDIVKGLAVKLLCSCGNPQAPLEFWAGFPVCSAGVRCSFHYWPFTSSGGKYRYQTNILAC